MYMATWAIMLQFLMVLLIPFATLLMEGKMTHPETDEDGNVKWNPSGKIALIIVQVIRWIGFLLLYVGVVTVMIGISTMTPETANGRGAVPLVGDGKVGGQQVPGYDGVQEPYGANDVPGVGTGF